MIRTLALTLLALPAFAQQGPPNLPAPPTPPTQLHGQSRTIQMRMPRAEPGNDLGIVPPGTWWRYPETIKDINLSTDQQKKMDEIFRQNRIQLIDLKASLEKEQLNLEPILNGNPPDTGKAFGEISRIADLRADLEKANARMLLGLRAQLTADQWTRLQTVHPGTSFSIDMGRNWQPRTHEDRNTTTTTCVDGKGKDPKDCTTTTVNVKVANGKRVVTTCTQAPGQSTPKCTTLPASASDGSFNITIPNPLPPSFKIDVPRGGDSE